MNDKMNDDHIEDEAIEPTGEENVDELELEDIEDASNQKYKKIKEKLAKCEKEKAEHLENLQRAKAEFLNGKKRLDEERIRDKERVINAHIEKLIPLADSFNMAMANKQVWGTVDENWRKGVESIYTQLQSLLTSYNVTELNPVGEQFNPEVHEAMSTRDAVDKEKPGTIVEVLQFGYEREGTLIRPAKVILTN